MPNLKPRSHNRDSAHTRPKPFFTRTLRDFFRKRTAVTLVEFAVIAIPFFTLITGIIEVGLIFWAGYELENATAAAARLVRTGQAQTSGYTVDQLRSQLCQNVVILSNCTTKVQLSVQTFSTFAGITSPSAVNQNGGLQTNFNYSAGGPRSHRVPCRVLRVASDNPSHPCDPRESWRRQLPSSEQFRISQ